MFSKKNQRTLTHISTGASITALIIAFLLLTFPLSGQQNSGSIKGTVRDPSGFVVPAATVNARDLATGVISATRTDAAGAYVLLNLPIGEYELEVGSSGFKTATIQDIRLDAGETLTFDIKLILGTVSQTVVTSGSTATLDTTTSTMGATLTSEEFQSLPLEMVGAPRTALSVLSSFSSITSASSSSGSGGAPGPSAVVNGSLTYANIEGSNGYASPNGNYASFTIDGMNASYKQFAQIADYASLLPEAVQEVRLASNFNADSGWNNGTEIALISKSGTNQFHGSAFEYVQNTALDSKNYFASSAASDHQNEFGFVLGGPIRKDRTFFFGTLDFFIYHVTPAGVIASVPTPQMLTGDFSQTLGAQIGTDELNRPIYQNEIYDPSTTRQLSDGTFIRDPYDCNGNLNTICPAELSQLSQAFAAGYPAPNLSGIQNNWVGLDAPSPTTVHKFSLKFDHLIGERFKLTAGLDAAPQYNIVAGSADFGPQLTTSLYVPSAEYRPRISFTATLRPNLLYSFNIGASVLQQRLNMGDQPSATAGAKAGLKGVYTPSLPVVSMTSMTGFGTGPYQYGNPQYTLPSIGTYFAWLKGSHSIKFGGDYIRSSIADDNLEIGTSGAFSFSNLTTGLPGYTNTGWGFASYLIGDVLSGTLDTGYTLHHFGQGWDAYAQDQWRLTPEITLNYGFRWSATQGPWEQHDSYGAFNPNIPNPGAGGLPGALWFWGKGAGLNGLHYLVKPNYGLVEPRLGIAYAPSAKSGILAGMVFRAYYGLIATPNFSGFNEGTGAPSYGISASATSTSTNNGITSAFEWDNGFPITPVVPDRVPSLQNGSSVVEIDYNNNEVGRTQSFGLSIERTLPWHLGLQGEYLGKLTHGIVVPTGTYPGFGSGWPINQLAPGYLSLGNLLLENINSTAAQQAGINPPYPGFSGSVAQALLPFPQYTGISIGNDPSGFSEYNAGHFSLQKRFGSGLSFLANYTVSKNLVSGAFQDVYTNQRKMLSPGDVPRVFALSYAYQLPFGRGRELLNSTNSVLDRAVSDWSVSGIQSYSAGGIIDVTTEASIPGITDLWAVRNPGIPIRTGTSCGGYNRINTSPYLNINAFSTPAPFTLGNVYTLPSVRNCGFPDENLSVTKGIRVKESMRLNFSANFFNAFNRHVFTGLGTDINNSATFGTFSGATSPRSIQLAGRFEF